MVSTEAILWTQVGSIVGYIVSVFFLYRLLVQQKNATIDLQKEKIEYLMLQLDDARAQTPDMLAQGLAARVKLYEEELKRLRDDKSTSEEQVKSKEAELCKARIAVGALVDSLQLAEAELKEFQCPDCGSPLSEKAYSEESVEGEDFHEYDVEHEYVAYACGRALHDGKVTRTCKSKRL